MAYSPMTTAEKRAARIQRGTLLALKTALAPSSGRERLSLNSVQRQGRKNLESGTTVSLSATESALSGRSKSYALNGLCIEKHGKLSKAECRAVQPSALEPEYGLLWADLTPVQRKALRKYRAGKKRERELAMSAKQLKREGEIEEARRHLQIALAAAESTSIDYWHKRLQKLTGKNRPADKQEGRYVSGRVIRKEG